MTSASPTLDQRLGDREDFARTVLARVHDRLANENAAENVLFGAACRIIKGNGEEAADVRRHLPTQLSAIPWHSLLTARNLMLQEHWLVDRRFLRLIITYVISHLIATIKAWRNAKAQT